MIAIVGGGVAGWAACQAFAAAGIDEEVLLLGAEGEAPYERPALSKGFLTDHAAEHPPPLGGDEHPAIAIRLGSEAVALDPGGQRIETAAGETLDYDRVLIATGARPRRLKIPGYELDGIHYLREAADARRLRPLLTPGRRVVVIGGGVIGLEVASSARDLGCEVTVVEAAERLLGRVVPAEFAAEIEAIHRAHGVTIRTASPPAELSGREGRVSGVVLAGGEELAADVVLVGIGVEPRVELAAAAGLAVDNGIVVDEFLRTGEPRIFAAGDVAAVLRPGEPRPLRFEQWRAAEAQGRLAAANMIGTPTAYEEIPWMWSDQYDLHVQAAGHGFGGAEIVRRGAIEEREGLVFFGIEDSRVVAVCGVARGTGVAKAVRLAETLIQHRIPVDAEALANPGEDLRKLLKRAVAAAG